MISTETQNQLHQKYNPDGSELRLLQNHLLLLLDYFDKICQDNNIKYWLSSGTCLGSIRHGGFIPWDDDIDVEMLREDYLKFIKVWKDNNDFVLQTYKNDLYYTEPFAKLRLRNTYVSEGYVTSLYRHKGIFLDIFIMEQSNAIVAHICHFLLGSLRHLSFHLKSNCIINFGFKLLKNCCFGVIDCLRLFNFLSNGKELRHTIGTGVVRNVRNKEDIFPLGQAKFENSTYPIPGNVDSYLKKMYGDYMEIPHIIHTHSLKSIIFLSESDFHKLSKKNNHARL